MSVFERLKRRISCLLLRGRLLSWWVTRKVRRVERVYADELVRASHARPAPERLPTIASAMPLRRLLFISDIMWEGKELVPELQKISPVQTLNLRPILHEATGALPASDVVVTAVRNFIGTQRGYEPDAILFYARGSLLSEETFHLLRGRWKCPLLGMNLDEKMEFLPHGVFSDGNDDYQKWARKFDLNLTNVRAVMDWYADRGLPVRYMPEGYHPKLAEPPPSSPPNYRYEFSFVGSKRSERVALIERLGALGLSVKPMGFGWPDSSGGAQPEAVYRASMMNLGIGYASPSLALTTLKTRDFECPGSGACYLTTWNWELALHYDIGREILCYRNEEELVEIFSYYRRRPEECAKIALAAWRKCLAEHTWEKRFRRVFAEMGFHV
jgi:spore maturation protein CgeB